MSDVHDIFVRAHTVIPENKGPQRPAPAKWPEEVLVIDTETAFDTVQKLTLAPTEDASSIRRDISA